ncbi:MULTISPECIES: signal recognition particle-docking protein FtsY [unclassified Aureimonas]|uniref:signal recognition particle-docking protein FtsY n=1 Tax=unclassified Aureimonas TaxID=2615206 RepID=UPI0006F862B0|nr:MULTISPECIES: signal recognition particle-docking protein FtsY [unclassified Aureimonas]KQT65921.1 hypothetical protein ASG62_20550 [Aureimonas sp. Leaf427]KQT73280.1 hypothetical protein ASG54_17030 [Aureimonas sp. Leaf460]
MSENKGFFRRIFSFGSARVEDERPPAEPPVASAAAEAPPAPPVERDATPPAPPASFEPEVSTRAEPEHATLVPPADQALSLETRPAEALAPLVVTPPETTAEPAPPTRDAETAALFSPEPSPAREPEPAADAPAADEADFSWLDAPLPPEDEIEAATQAPVDETTPLPDPAPDLAEEPEAFGEPVEDFAAEPLPEDEADFSFLDADAPLPPEDEEAEPDFSFLEPEARADGSADTLDDTVPHEGWRRREAPAVPEALMPVGPRIPWFERLRQGLARSSSQLSGSITALFTKKKLDEATLQDFEDVLLQADLGYETATRITDRLSEGRFGKEISGAEVRAILAAEVEATLAPVALPLELDLDKKPHVILVVGVNGTGKTTTIGKLAAKLVRGGLKVTLCAGDTFRAAAVEQLKIWGERTGSEVVAKAIGADAAGLAYEAYDRAVENGSDVLIIDTAGRLQNKAELMAELEKIVRVLNKREPDAPHTVLQTLDATTGQNALSQVEIFRNVAGVNGLVMTKLDGTARGGILVAIAARHKLPVYFIGVGEGIDDLEPFRAKDFADAIAGTA